MKTIWKFLKILRKELSCNPAIPLLNIYLKKMRTGFQKDVCFSLFIAELFTITKIWEKPKGPSVHEWTKNYAIYIYIMEHFSATRKKEIQAFVPIWMNLEYLK